MYKEGLIIFDMDGTLIDSSKSMTKSINHVRSHLSLPPFSVEKVVKLINEPDNDLPKLFYEDKMPYSECRKIFESHYKDNCLVDMELYEGVKEMLENLSKSFKLALLSNAYGEFVKRMTRFKEIDRYFEMTLGSDDTGYRKPDPRGIFYILDKLKFEKNRALYIGDSLKDEMAAKNAGIKYIFVDWGFGEYENPDAIISGNDISQAKSIIKSVM